MFGLAVSIVSSSITESLAGRVFGLAVCIVSSSITKPLAGRVFGLAVSFVSSSITKALAGRVFGLAVCIVSSSVTKPLAGRVCGLAVSIVSSVPCVISAQLAVFHAVVDSAVYRPGCIWSGRMVEPMICVLLLCLHWLQLVGF